MSISETCELRCKAYIAESDVYLQTDQQATHPTVFYVTYSAVSDLSLSHIYIK